MAALFLTVSSAIAQDPVKVDAKHYKVVLENEQVRVLKIHYGPHEKSIMHEHPGAVAVFLSGGKVRFTLPDGKTEEAQQKAGGVQWNGAGKHLPENLGDEPLEVILVELKGGSSAAAGTGTEPQKPAE
ncbi:MAG: cupin domain-containing protein [Candidatus Binatia bacterium]